MCIAAFYPVTDTLFPLGADMLKFHCHAHFASIEQKGNMFASYKLGEGAETGAPMSYDRLPDRQTRPMSQGQAATLRTLSVEAYQPKLFEENLTREEADRRIEALRQEIALANSF
jgi:Protein of unknown function (DUF3072)